MTEAAAIEFAAAFVFALTALDPERSLEDFLDRHGQHVDVQLSLL
ncbi:hypothetical protein [Bradyrhizobium sp. CB2312]|nr:hypothetical protein [Bradyrhizobium sp. CB2312]WFU75231.1 hypothetical protein QA642_15000 [Bradyrhizobium sp. CB2312]